MVVNTIAERWNVELQSGGEALRGDHVFKGRATCLMLPQCYMNHSGVALQGIFDKPAGEDLIVVYDDVDLPVGELRLRGRGGSGGHRGVESVAATCGDDFVRVRVGVGRPPAGESTADYVLAELGHDEIVELAPVTERAAEAVECVLDAGLVTAMNRFNGHYTRGEIEGDNHA